MVEMVQPLREFLTSSRVKYWKSEWEVKVDVLLLDTTVEVLVAQPIMGPMQVVVAVELRTSEWVDQQ